MIDNINTDSFQKNSFYGLPPELKTRILEQSDFPVNFRLVDRKSNELFMETCNQPGFLDSMKVFGKTRQELLAIANSCYRLSMQNLENPPLESSTLRKLFIRTAKGLSLDHRVGVSALKAHFMKFMGSCTKLRLWLTLYKVARDGNWEAVLFILSNDIRLKKELKISVAFEEAAESGHEEVCRILLESNREITEDEMGRALLFAISHGHIAICELILQSGREISAEELDTSLAIASRNGNERRICQFLLQRRREEVSRENKALLHAAATVDWKTYQRLVKSSKWGLSPMGLLARIGATMLIVLAFILSKIQELWRGCWSN